MPIEFCLSFLDPETAPYFVVLKDGGQIAKSQVKGSKTAKKKPRPNAGTEAFFVVFTHCRRAARAEPECSRNARYAEDVFRLIVQGERQEVILRIVAEVAGLVYENRELPHAKPPPDKENAGGFPGI